MTTKSLGDLQNDVALVSDIYANRFGIERDAAWYLLKLTEELGELTSANLKRAGNGRTSSQSNQELNQALADEAADLFAHLLLFCQDRNINLEEAVDGKWMRHLPKERQSA